MIRCVILDDEPIALEILEGYLAKLPGFACVGAFQNPLEALPLLQHGKVDLLLLDIQMPELSGLQLLESLTHPVEVILTTAHREFALEGFEHNVVDYLLKPIAFERFLKAIHRFQRRQATPLPMATNSPLVPAMPETITLRVDRKNVRLPLTEIRYVEALKDYLKVHTPHKIWVTKLPLNEMAKLLPEASFLQIHRSYIVGLRYITAYSTQEIELGTIRLPIGRTYRERSLGRLKSEK